MEDHDQLRLHAERVRAAGVLGRSGLMHRLFDFLLECSLAGRAPKEVEVAMSVFGKGGEFDVSQDALVRVYVHKLRKKLEEFAHINTEPGAAKLLILKGEYRFAVENAALPVPVTPTDTTVANEGDPSDQSTHIRRRVRWLIASLAIALLCNAILATLIYRGGWHPSDITQAARASPIWAPLLADNLPIYIVLGDYYMFGEVGEVRGASAAAGATQVKRLVREFSVNSREDLEMFAQQYPDEANRYRDLGLAYLPTASALALHDVLPVFMASGKPVHVVLASTFDPSVLRSAHVVYVGLLSGMGMLRDLAFSGSRYSAGMSADELIDSGGKHRYASQSSGPIGGKIKYRDYGYFSTLPGPAHNRIVVITGTRDEAVMHTAELVTNVAGNAELLNQVRKSSSLEALYEVFSVDRANLDGKLLLASRLRSDRIWGEGDGASAGGG